MKGFQIATLAVVLVLIGGLIAAKAMKGKAAPAGGPTTSEARAPVEKPLPKMLELGSVGCKPCTYMAPIIDSLEKELAGRVFIKFYDVNEDPALAEQYKVEVIPTQVFLDASGKELFRHIGVFEKAEILAKLKELKMLK